MSRIRYIYDWIKAVVAVTAAIVVGFFCLRDTSARRWRTGDASAGELRNGGGDMEKTKREVIEITRYPARRWMRINGGWVEALPGETRSDVEKAVRSIRIRLAEVVR